jgi:hypothetical protein
MQSVGSLQIVDTKTTISVQQCQSRQILGTESSLPIESIPAGRFFEVENWIHDKREYKVSWKLTGGEVRTGEITRALLEHCGQNVASMFSMTKDNQVCAFTQLGLMRCTDFSRIAFIAGTNSSFGLHVDTMGAGGLLEGEQVQSILAPTQNKRKRSKADAKHKAARVALSEAVREYQADGGEQGSGFCYVDSFGVVMDPTLNPSPHDEMREETGHKIVWAYTPDYGPDDLRKPGQADFFGWLRAYFADDPYARLILDGETPTPLCILGQGLRMPRCSEWTALWTEYHVPNHFHLLRPSNAYVIRRGAYHFFINSNGMTASLACDLLHPAVRRKITVSNTDTGNQDTMETEEKDNKVGSTPCFSTLSNESTLHPTKESVMEAMQQPGNWRWVARTVAAAYSPPVLPPGCSGFTRANTAEWDLLEFRNGHGFWEPHSWRGPSRVARNSGLGLYAARDFTRWTVVTVYTCTDIMNTFRNHEKLRDYTKSARGAYCLKLDDGRVVDGTRGGFSGAHLCNDCGSAENKQTLQCDGCGVLTAYRNIRVGDELLWPYGTAYWVARAGGEPDNYL